MFEDLAEENICRRAHSAVLSSQLRFRPLHLLCAEGVQVEVLAMVLELHGDPNGGKPGDEGLWVEKLGSFFFWGGSLLLQGFSSTC